MFANTARRPPHRQRSVGRVRSKFLIRVYLSPILNLCPRNLRPLNQRSGRASSHLHGDFQRSPEEAGPRRAGRRSKQRRRLPHRLAKPTSITVAPIRLSRKPLRHVDDTPDTRALRQSVTHSSPSSLLRRRSACGNAWLCAAGPRKRAGSPARPPGTAHGPGSRAYGSRLSHDWRMAQRFRVRAGDDRTRRSTFTLLVGSCGGGGGRGCRRS